MARLQLEIRIDTNRDGSPEARLTPIDIELPDDAVAPMQAAIALADMHDAEPGDGEVDARFSVRQKVRINLFIARLNTHIDADAETTLRIVE